jgi:hypothetical protein
METPSSGKFKRTFTDGASFTKLEITTQTVLGINTFTNAISSIKKLNAIKRQRREAKYDLNNFVRDGFLAQILFQLKFNSKF